METNNPMDALRSSRPDSDVVIDSSGKMPNFEALSRRRVNRRVLIGAALALGLMVPTAMTLLSSNKPSSQLAEADKGAKKKVIKKKKKKKTVVTTAPATPISTNSGAAAELGLSLNEVIKGDQGFRSTRDGFNFPNYGGAPTDDAIDTTIMVALFGKSNVCADPTSAGCVELPGATDVKNQLNDALAAGRCEGFAALSQRFFDGLDQRPNGAKTTSAVSRLDVAKQISYWWATQVAPSVSSSTKTYRAKTPSALVTSLATGLNQKTGFTLGLYSPQGGHSVSPLAVTTDGAKSNIYVYDNNYPKEIRKIVVDPATETWTYGAASINSSSASDTWTGTGAGSMDLTPMSVRKGPFNVSFGSTRGATKGSTYRVIVTQKQKKKNVKPAPFGAVLTVGTKSVNTLNFRAAGKSPFNSRSFMAGSKGVGAVAYIPVKAGASGEVRVKPSGNSAYGDFAVSMDRPGLPALYASSASTFTMVGRDGASTDSIFIEGITGKITIKVSNNDVSHIFELPKGYSFIVEATNGNTTFQVENASGKVVYEGVIPVNVPDGAVLNIYHSFDESTSTWTTTREFASSNPVDNFFVNNLAPRPANSTSDTTSTTTTLPGSLDFPLRGNAGTTTTTSTTTTLAPTTTTLAPETVSVSVAGTRFYGAANSSIVWDWSCAGSAEGCAWAKARFDANELDVSVSADETSSASNTPYSGAMSLANGVTAPSNVTLTTSVALTVEPRALTVTANRSTKTYGNQDPLFSASTLGLVDGDSLSGSFGRVAGESVGTYAITQGTVTNENNPNYNITFVGNNLTINAKAVTVTAAAKSKTYGESDPALTYSVSPALVGSDTLSGSLARATGENVGTYAINQGTVANSNYTITFTGADLTIDAKAVTVTAAAKSKTYGAVDPALTYSVSPALVGSDAFTGSLSRVAGENVGSYAINKGTVANSNYDITFVGADLTVNAKSVVVTPDSGLSKTYGSNDPALTYTVSPALVGSDTLTGALDRAAGDTVGTYAITLGTLANSNYDVTLSGTTVNFTVTSKAVTVTAVAKSKTYGESDPVLTYTTVGLEGGDTLSGSLTRVAGDTVGTYAINKGTLANADYTITFVGADLTVNAKAVTVTADAKSKTYGESDPALTYSVSPALVGSDTLSGSLARATGENVGTYAINQGTVANSNYTITFTGADLTIDAKAVTVTAAAKSKTYGAVDPALTYSVSPALVGSDAFTGSLSRVAGENVGDFDITQGTLALSSNYDITFTGAKLTIDAKAVTVTADAKSKTYGSVDPALTYSVSPALVGSDAFTGSLSRVAGENVGDFNITQGTLVLSSNYTVSFTGAKLTINAKAVTVTADAKSKTYGESDPALTYQTVGLVGSETLSGSLARATGETVGTYAINQGTVTNANNSNYDITFTGANLTVNAKAVTVTADAKSKTYGESDPALTYSVSTALVGSDAFTGSLSRVAGENVGDFNITQGTLALSSNYTVSFTGAKLTIDAKAVTVTAAAKSKTYGEVDPALTYTVTTGSLETGDAFTGSLSRVAGENVGDFNITQGTLALSSNYDITFTGAKLTINAKAVTVTAAAKSKTYGESDPALTYSVSTALVGSDAFTGSLSRVAGENVGDFNITQGTLALSSNYTVSFTGAKLTIDAKAVTVTAAAKSKTYGSVDPELTYSVSPALVGSDAFTGSLSRVAGENVGDFNITQGTLVLSSNYTVSFTGAKLTINAKAVTVTAAAKSKTYGESDPALTYQTVGLVGSETLSGSLARATGETVGTYAINQGTVTNANNSNYDITFTGANLTVNAKAVTVTAAAKSKTYGSVDPALTYTVTTGSLETGDAFTGSLSRVAGENVGDFDITQGTLALSSNYTLSFTGAKLTINAKAVTVTAAAKSKTYGSVDPELTYTVTTGSLETGDAFTGSLSRVAGENVGDFNITQGTLALSSNYDITFTGAKLTIDAKAVTVTAAAKSKTYGSVDPELTYSVSPALVGSDAFTGSLSRVAGENVGDFNITQGDLALSSNYTVSFTGAKLTIDAKAVTVTADAKSKTYGESDPALTYQTVGLVGSDTLSGSLARAAGDSVGTYAINKGTLANSNYTISFTGANLTIDAKAVTVTADAKSKTYGEVDPALTYSVSPALVGSDTLSGSLARAAGDSVGTYAINKGTLANSNYTISFTGANLTIDAKAVTVTAAAKSKTYGEVDPAFTYSTSPALVGSDVFTGSLARAAGDSVGTYAINQGTLANSNYTISFTGANLTVNAKAVTVTADAKSKTYGSADPAFTYSTSPALVGSDVFTGSLARAAGETVGTYAINKGTLANSNYTISFTGANLTVNAKAVTVTADAKSKSYADVDPALTYQTVGLVGSDTLSGSLTRAAGETVGTYAINQGTVTNANNSNYTITYVGANLTINTRAVSITADAKSKTFGGVDPALTYTLTSGTLKSGDAFTGALTRVAGENAGQYDINQGTVALNANYAITYVGAKFTINAAAVTATPVSGQQAEIGSGYKVQLNVTGLLGTDGYTGDAAFTDALGDQQITVGTLAVGSNYTLNFTTGVTIKVVSQLPISLTWKANNGSVDATGLASIGAKIDVTATGGGSGALTWNSTGSCTLSVVSASTQTIQKAGGGSCTLTVTRAASAGRVSTSISQTFTWSNK